MFLRIVLETFSYSSSIFVGKPSFPALQVSVETYLILIIKWHLLSLDLQESISRIHRTIELMYSDKSMIQVSWILS